MKLRSSLATKILAWLFLNLLLLVVVAIVFFRVQFHLGMDWLINSAAGERVQSVAERIANDLRDQPRADWNALLQEFGETYGVEFSLFHIDGRHLAGRLVDLPPEVRERMRVPGPSPAGRGGPPEGRGGPGDRGRRPPPAPAFQKSMIRTVEPTQYWVLVHLRAPDEGGARPIPISLIARSSSVTGGGLFFNVTPWLLVVVATILLCVLFWLPLVLGMTRAVSQLTRATEQIAEGRFDVRVSAHRHDELGSLARSVNRLADRLNGFVTGQKRFLGDISHELCAPIARLQMIIGILEQQAAEQGKQYVGDAAEEVQEIAALVNELLSFSRAGLRSDAVALGPVELRSVVMRVIQREDLQSRVQVEIPDSCQAMAEPELLARATANLIRNAFRYAGAEATIRVVAERTPEGVELTVVDSGPGVSEEDLPRLFDPFYRAEGSRSRDTGGVGLGLAIVKTCVEACQGSVTARNTEPTGLAVTIRLTAC